MQSELTFSIRWWWWWWATIGPIVQNIFELFLMPAYNTVQTFIVIQKFKWIYFTILLIKTKMHDMN